MKNRNLNTLMYPSMLFMLLFNILACMAPNINTLWILMELNNMLFIFMMISYYYFSNPIIYYFLTQAISSLLMIFMLNINYLSMTIMDSLFYLCMALKLGLFPFFWFPPFLFKNLNWLLIFLFSTSQKFIPLLMYDFYLSDLNKSWTYLFFFCLISILYSSIKAIFSLNLKIIMILSSINNTSWMLMLIIIDFYSFLSYFLIYSFILMMIMFFFYFNHTESFYNFSHLNSFNNIISLYLMMLNLCMIPPFLTSSIKLYGLFSILSTKLMFLSTLLIIFTGFSILMYFFIIFKIYHFSKFKIKFSFKTNYKHQSYLFILTPFLVMTLFYMSWTFIM